MISIRNQSLVLVGLILMLSLAGRAENWPQWRGPQANGLSGETGIPTRWKPSENIAWKTSLDGLGASTPIVWGDSIFLTSQVGGGQKGGRDFPNATAAKESTGVAGIEFLVLGFHRSNGGLLWKYRLKASDSLPAVHIKHNLASPSCVTDGSRIYAWFGTGQVLALDMKGNLVWEKDLGRDYQPFDIRWGHGSSPALYKDSLILLCDHNPSSYLLALDKRTGRRRWLVKRGSGQRSYTTPLVIPGRGGDQLVINGKRGIEVFDPASGGPLWSAGEPNRVPVPTPVYHDGVLYASRGYRSGPYLALRADRAGEVLSDRTLWQVPTGAPYVASLLYHQGLVYMATENGIASCIDARTGRVVWRKRLGGVFSASPVAAEGNIYLTAESGQTVVIKAGREFKILARNETGERTLASPAISGGHLFLRTDDHLIRVGQ